MATLQIYEKLLLFPLFQGMSRDDLEQVAGHTRFGFSKFNAGSTVVAEGDDCRQMYFLINGSLRVETMADDRGYMVVEQMEAPLYRRDGCQFHHCRQGRDTAFVRGFSCVPSEPAEYICYTDTENIPPAMAACP